MGTKLDAYKGLLQQIRSDLRRQHPEWIEPDGCCPMCDSYEARLLKLLDVPTAREPNGNSAAAMFC
jgi:hypothetical protein